MCVHSPTQPSSISEASLKTSIASLKKNSVTSLISSKLRHLIFNQFSGMYAIKLFQEQLKKAPTGLYEQQASCKAPVQ